MSKTAALRENMKDPPPSFENVLYELGMPGRFQITQIGVLFLCCFLSSWTSLTYIFQGYEPPHVCNTVNESQLLSKYNLQNDSKVEVTYQSCDLIIATNQSGRMKNVAKLSCPNGRNFSDVLKTTWISEWDLVCESKGLAEFTFSMLNVGQIFGGCIGSLLTDRYGRKPVYLACCMICTLFETTVVFAPNIYVIIALKFGTGFCQKAMVACGFVYSLEFLAPKHRQIYGSCRGLNWVFIIVVFAAIAYLVKDLHWQYLQIAVCCSGIFTILGFIYLDESPRWLAANGRTGEALVILRKASKQNGKDFERIKQLFNEYINHTFPSTNAQAFIPLNKLDEETRQQGDAIESADIFADIKENKTKKDSILDLLKNKRLLISTIITSYIWLVHVLTYYGLVLTSSKLAGDRFVNFVLMIVVEIPSYVFVCIILRYVGRTTTISLCLTATGISLTASTLCQIYSSEFEWSGGVSTAFFIFGKWSISASFCCLYIMTPELYPTNLRLTASGFCNSVSRVGSMVAPYMGMLYDIISWGPGCFFTVLSVTGAVLVMLLPETRGTDLPNTMKELVIQQEERSRKKDKT